MAMKQREGFTLISVLVAVVLLSTGIMALARSMWYVAKVTRTENQRTQALELATQYMEELRERDPWGLVNEGPTTIDTLGAVNANGTFTRQVAVTNEGTQLVRVTLTVTPRSSRPLVLRTLIFKVSTS
jgi:type IV pilus assembly protein PilV